MDKKNIFDTHEITIMIQNNDRSDKLVAIRRIWTDWKFYTEDEQNQLTRLGPQIYDLFKEDNSERDIWQLMLALGTLNYEPAIQNIFELLKTSESENIQGFAADALSRFTSYLNPKIVSFLWSLFEKSDSLVVRINSLRALSVTYYGSKDKDLSNKLFESLSYQDHSVIRNAILDAIGEIGSLQNVPDLAHMMIARRTAMDKKSAGRALDRIAQINGMDDRNNLLKKIGKNKIE